MYIVLQVGIMKSVSECGSWGRVCKLWRCGQVCMGDRAELKI